MNAITCLIQTSHCWRTIECNQNFYTEIFGEETPLLFPLRHTEMS